MFWLKSSKVFLKREYTGYLIKSPWESERTRKIIYSPTTEDLISNTDYTMSQRFNNIKDFRIPSEISYSQVNNRRFLFSMSFRQPHKRLIQLGDFSRRDFRKNKEMGKNIVGKEKREKLLSHVISLLNSLHGKHTSVGRVVGKKTLDAGENQNEIITLSMLPSSPQKPPILSRYPRNAPQL